MMKSFCSFLILIGVVLLLAGCNNQTGTDQTPQYVYVSTASGIGIFEWSATAGVLKEKGLERTASPVSYLTVDTAKRTLYTVGEKISAYKIKKDGSLRLLNEFEPIGAGACHVSLTNSGKNLLVAFYVSGSASMYEIQKDGSVGERVWTVQHYGSSVNEQRQESAHAHMILPVPNSQLLVVPDLGIDKVMCYAIDSAGYVSEAPIPYASIRAGGGPRHLAFHPKENLVYVLHELTGHVTGFRYDPVSGISDSINTVSILPEDFTEFNKSADIHISPDGQYLYVSNRGHNSIAVCKINSETGELVFLKALACGGVWPRAFEIDPSGGYVLVANKRSNQISVMEIDKETGMFQKISEIATPEGPQSIRFISK